MDKTREAKKRVLAMVAQMDKEDCATCTNLYECQAACPKRYKVSLPDKNLGVDTPWE